MAIPDVILNDLRRIVGMGDSRVEWRDLVWWSQTTNLSMPELYNNIAESVARSYKIRKISYVEADCIMNELYFSWVLNEQMKTTIAPWPNLFLDIYLAFDGGEYRRTDANENDPVVDCVDPAIEVILSLLKS